MKNLTIFIYFHAINVWKKGLKYQRRSCVFIKRVGNDHYLVYIDVKVIEKWTLLSENKIQDDSELLKNHAHLNYLFILLKATRLGTRNPRDHF